MPSEKLIVLASESPRRKQLLERIGLDFITMPTNFEEKMEGLPAEELAVHNAMGKAQKLIRSYKNALIIGADTVGAHMDQILGKPKDREDAKRILRFLSNSTHKVITGLAIYSTNTKKFLTDYETTYVTIDRLEEADIEAYLDSGEGADKAAGYAIQGLGSLFVKKIEGDYFNVVGLPIYKLRKMLNKLGYQKWWKA